LVAMDLERVFGGWDLLALPFQKDPEFRGGMAAIKIVEGLGFLPQLESSGTVSRSTMHRYRKKREKNSSKFDNTVKPCTFVPKKGAEQGVYDFLRSPSSFFNK